MKKLTLSIILLLLGINQLSADEYSTNKRYSFQEVAEVLSEKIIEDREKIVYLYNEIEELKSQIKNTETGVSKKISELNNNVSNKNRPRETDNSGTVNNATMKNIEISSELYNKVR